MERKKMIIVYEQRDEEFTEYIAQISDEYGSHVDIRGFGETPVLAVFDLEEKVEEWMEKQEANKK